MDTTRPLRAALLANALFSTGCGALMIVQPATEGGVLGIEMSVALRVIGSGLLIFAADLVHQATRPRMATWRAWSSHSAVGNSGRSVALTRCLQ